MEKRSRFAWLPILRWSGEYFRNGFYWLRFVHERRTRSGWKATEIDN